jgi:hypothetical protein
MQLHTPVEWNKDILNPFGYSLYRFVSASHDQPPAGHAQSDETPRNGVMRYESLKGISRITLAYGSEQGVGLLMRGY